MSDLRIEYVDLDELPEAARNARVHDLDAIAAAYRRLGFMRPGLIDERTGRLVAGHGRRLALRRDLDRGGTPPKGIPQTAGGWAMPVVRGWSSRDDAEADAAALADNKVGESGSYDEAVLLDILSDLAADAPDLLRAAHFDSDDLDRLLESTSTPAGVDLAGLGDELPDSRPRDHRERDDEQWGSGDDPDEGSTREPDGPGPLDVEPAWRTVEPMRARYHDGTPDGADRVARWLRSHAKDVHVDGSLIVSWTNPDGGGDCLIPGKWVTRYRGRLDVLTRDELHDEFVPANEPARRADRDAKPVTAPKAAVPSAAELLRNGTGVLLGSMGPAGLQIGRVAGGEDTAPHDE